MDPSYWLSTTSPEALGAYGSVGAQYGPGAPGTIGYDQGVAQAGSNATSPWQPTDQGVTNALKFHAGHSGADGSDAAARRDTCCSEASTRPFGRN